MLSEGEEDCSSNPQSPACECSSMALTWKTEWRTMNWQQEVWMEPSGKAQCLWRPMSSVLPAVDTARTASPTNSLAHTPSPWSGEGQGKVHGCRNNKVTGGGGETSSRCTHTKGSLRLLGGGYVSGAACTSQVVWNPPRVHLGFTKSQSHLHITQLVSCQAFCPRQFLFYHDPLRRYLWIQ